MALNQSERSLDASSEEKKNTPTIVKKEKKMTILKKWETPGKLSS